MTEPTTARKQVNRLARDTPSVKLPVTGTKVNLPGRGGLAWYAGIGAMAAVELVEWPVALLIAGTHFIERHTHNRDLQELAEGVDADA